MKELGVRIEFLPEWDHIPAGSIARVVASGLGQVVRHPGINSEAISEPFDVPSGTRPTLYGAEEGFVIFVDWIN